MNEKTFNALFKSMWATIGVATMVAFIGMTSEGSEYVADSTGTEQESVRISSFVLGTGAVLSAPALLILRPFAHVLLVNK